MPRLSRELLRAAANRKVRGFTVVELLAVVAMIGILSALAIVGYRKYMTSARTGEAKDIIGAIRIAEESYRAETMGYLNCSPSNGWYPAPPDGKKRHWTQTHADAQCWKMLNVNVDAPTSFGFIVNAGVPGGTAPAPMTCLAAAVAWPQPITEPWYVVQATGDNDTSSTGKSCFVASSFSGEIVSENETE